MVLKELHALKGRTTGEEFVGEFRLVVRLSVDLLVSITRFVW